MFKYVATAVLLGIAPAAHGAQLLVNGNFEANGGSLAGWTTSGIVLDYTAADYRSCCGTRGAEPRFSTDHFASFGPGNLVGTHILSQTFATVVGATYDVAFSYGALGTGSNLFGVSIGGVGSDYTAFSNNDLDATYTPVTFSFVASATNATLIFALTTGVDQADLILNDISVTGAPEPASWALMIGGFGLVGRAMRQRRTVAA